jgi:hypothetical protein
MDFSALRRAWQVSMERAFMDFEFQSGNALNNAIRFADDPEGGATAFGIQGALATPSQIHAQHQAAPILGLKARHVIAWVGASSASAGPGHPRQPISEAL